MQPLGGLGVRSSGLAEPVQAQAFIGSDADVAVQVDTRQQPLRFGVAPPRGGFQTAEAQLAEGVVPAQLPQLVAQREKAFGIRLGEQLGDALFRAGSIEFPRCLILERDAVKTAGGAKNRALIGIVQIEESQREFGHQIAAGSQRFKFAALVLPLSEKIIVDPPRHGEGAQRGDLFILGQAFGDVSERMRIRAVIEGK